MTKERYDLTKHCSFNSRLRNNRIGKNEEYRQQQNQERDSCTRKLLRREQLFKVAVFQLFAAVQFLRNLLENRILRRCIFARINLFRNHELTFILLPVITEQIDGEDKQRNRESQTIQNEHTKINIDALILEC